MNEESKERREGMMLGGLVFLALVYALYGGRAGWDNN